MYQGILLHMAGLTNSQIKGLPLEDAPGLLDSHGPIFLFGSPRSGTTFLSRCVTSAQNVEEFVGILAPARIMHLIAEYRLSGQDASTLMSCLRDVFWQSFLKSRFWKSERLSKILKGKMSPWAIRAPYTLDDALFCYKEPFLCLAANEFAKEFPCALFVHIIRDGRDVAASLVRRYPNALSDEVLQCPELARSKNSEIGSFVELDGWTIPWWVEKGSERKFIGASQYSRCLWLWSTLVRHALALRENVPDDRYLEIRYEDLALNAVHEGERILEFIGKPLSRVFRKQMKRAYGSSVGTHKKLLADGVVSEKEIESFAGRALEQLGYL